MSYATRADLEARFGAEEVAHLLGDGPDRTVAALADAAAEIDAALAERYRVPLAPALTYPPVVAIACDLARQRLYDDEAIAEVAAAAERARTRLAHLASGRWRIFDLAGGLVRARTHARTSGPSPRLALDPDAS